MTTHLVNMIIASLVSCALVCLTVYEGKHAAHKRPHFAPVPIEAGESIVIYAPAGYAAVRVHASCDPALALELGPNATEIVPSTSGFLVPKGKTAYVGRCSDGRISSGTIELSEHEGADPLVRIRPTDLAIRHVEGTVVPGTTLSVGTQPVAIRDGAFAFDVEHYVPGQSVVLRAEKPDHKTEVYVLEPGTYFDGSYGAVLIAQHL